MDSQDQKIKDQIRQLTADYLNGKISVEDIPHGRMFFTVQKVLWKMGKFDKVKEMGLYAKKRLIEKGYRYTPGIGWMRDLQRPFAGVVEKYGTWRIADPLKFGAYMDKNSKEGGNRG